MREPNAEYGAVAGLVLAGLLAWCCQPTPEPTRPDVPPAEPTRRELCAELCVLLEGHACDKFGICAEFDEASGECTRFEDTLAACADDCVANPGAYPADLKCASTFMVTGENADARWCASWEAVCPL